MADFNFNITYRPGKTKIDADVLSRIPIDLNKYMKDCSVEKEKEAICATIQAVIHQGDVTPWATVLSASISVAHSELAVTNLVFRQLTSDEIQSSKGRPHTARILAYKK